MNPALLAALRDIHVPPPPAPNALAWCAAGAVLVLLLLLTLLYSIRRRHLRAALRELAALAARHACDGDDTRLAGGLSRLLRQYAIRRFPDARVAALTGPPWLLFLDAHGGQGGFCGTAGAALEWRPYQRDGEFDAPALLILVRRWLRANPQ